MKHYETIRLLGRGGMGTVHEVRDRETGERYAMKTMLGEGARHLLRFKREFRSVAELNHPNLVRLFDLGVEDDAWYFTMELVDGVDLLEALDMDGASRSSSLPRPVLAAPPGWDSLAASGATLSQPANDDEEVGGREDSITRASIELNSEALTYSLGDLDPTEVGVPLQPGTPQLADTPELELEVFYKLIAQVLDALEYLHAQGLVHRDLKPSNVMVDAQGRVKLLDFGLASSVDRSHAISRTGMMVGTVPYMAPEQFTSEAVTAAADLYALGCIMFQILTGRLPLQGDAAQILRARLHAPPPRIERHVRGLPTKLTEIVYALMSRQAVERPSIKEVREALDLKVLGTASALHASGTHRAHPSGETLPFVGRAGELERIDASLSQTIEGETRFVLVEGEMGIGKTAFLKRCVQQARQKGLLYFRGRCFERERLPFAALDRATDSLIVTLSRWPSSRIEPLHEVLGHLTAMFPAMAMLTDEARPKLPLEPHQLSEMRALAFDAFCTLLEYCQQEAPLLFALDDLHWADEESLDLLEYVLERGVGRVCVIVTHRSSQRAEPDPGMRRLLSLARRAKLGARLRLGPMNVHDSAQLISAAGRDRLDPPEIKALSTRIEGNPSLALQLIEHVVQLDEASRIAYLDRLRRSGGALGALLEHLTPSAMQLLELIALSQQPLDEEILCSAGGFEASVFGSALDELTDAHLVQREFTTRPGRSNGSRSLDAPSKLRPQHDNIRSRVDGLLAPQTRKNRHRTLAVAMASDEARRLKQAEALLKHWQAADAHEEVRALALEVAQAAETEGDYPRAARMLQTALDTPVEAVQDPQAHAAERVRLGRLYEFAALRSQSVEALSQALVLREATIGHPRHDLSLNLLRGYLAEALLLNGDVGEGLSLFKTSMTRAGLSPRYATRAHVFVLVGLFLSMTLISVLPRAWVRRTRRERDGLALGYYAVAMRAMAPFWPQIGAEAALKSAILGLRTDDFQALQRVLCVKTLALVLAGKHTPRNVLRGAEDLDRAERLARQHDIPLGVENVMVYRAAFAAITDITRSRALIDEAIAALRAKGVIHSHEAGPAVGAYLMILQQQGDFDQLEVLCEEVIQHHHNIINTSYAHSICAWVYCIRGQLKEAQQLLDASSPLIETLPPSALKFAYDTARASFSTMGGAPERALIRGDALEEQWHAEGIFPKAHPLGLWLGAMLEAALVLLRRGELPAWRLLQTRRRARTLARLRSLDHGCLGFRALALIHHYEGKEAAALKTLQRALALSSRPNTGAYRRWLCLDASREVGSMTMDLESEARTLQLEGCFEPLPQ